VTYCIVFGFTSHFRSAVDRSVQTEPGLVRTTTDPDRAARWDSHAEAEAWLQTAGGGPVPAIGIGTGRLTIVGVDDEVPISPKGVAFEWRVSRSAVEDEPFRLEGGSSVKPPKRSAREPSIAASGTGDPGARARPEPDRGDLGTCAGLPVPADDRARHAEKCEPVRRSVVDRAIVTVWRSECVWVAAGRVVARWDLYSFDRLDPDTVDRGYRSFFDRKPAVPIRISTPAYPKLVTRAATAYQCLPPGVDLLTSADPFDGLPAELVVWAAQRNRRGLSLAPD
jgi:hypothetical protein